MDYHSQEFGDLRIPEPNRNPDEDGSGFDEVNDVLTIAENLNALQESIRFYMKKYRKYPTDSKEYRMITKLVIVLDQLEDHEKFLIKNKQIWNISLN